MITNLYKKIKAKFNRYRLFINPRIYRPSSKPFISGDTFRKISDHIFDETQTFKASSVKKNDLVFVKNDLLKYYFENYHIKIKNQYILISHNSDENIENENIKFLDENIIHWFVQNLNIKNSDKISAIPIGLENMRYRKNGLVKDFLRVKKIVEKKDGVLSAFNENTNFDERSHLKKIVDDIDYIENKIFSSTQEYLSALNKSKFCICPIGNGLDTHRIWESLIFDVTPIVTKNQMTQNFFEMGVPLLILDDWKQLISLSLEDLIDLNKINKNKDYIKYTEFDFWMNIVNSKKI